jgi:Mg-chelatase subunit ChlD
MYLHQNLRPRRGVVLTLFLLLLPVLVVLVALAVTVAQLSGVHQELQTAVDAAALAGARGLSVDRDEVVRLACEYAQKNYANGAAVVLQPSDVELGLWEPATREFTILAPDSTTRANAVRIMAHLSSSRGNAVGLFLGNLVGVQTGDLAASAIAQYGARDIVLTLDYSASMSYDSQFQNMSRLGRASVEQSLRNIWVDLGSPTYGTMEFTPVYIASTTTSTILTALGLDGVPYPYPSGSWSDYFQYVQTNGTIRDAGYRNYYGYLTLMNYLQAQQGRATATPDLWRTREEPITAVKDAVSLFLTYMRERPTDDRVGLASYTYTDGAGTVEVPLTDDYAGIETASRQRQAGHYHTYTNIGGGIAAARSELQARARIGTQKLIVLLSDGRTNWYHNTYNLADARQDALDQARLAAEGRIPILTISMGADADLDLMQQIADLTDGLHFIVPGGSTVEAYREQLYSVFADVAAYWPLKLVD